MAWKQCIKCGCTTLLDTDFCPYCGVLYKTTFSDNAYELRNRWKQALLQAASQGCYFEVLKGLAANTANRGNIFEFIKDFCQNADPWDGRQDR